MWHVHLSHGHPLTLAHFKKACATATAAAATAVTGAAVDVAATTVSKASGPERCQLFDNTSSSSSATFVANHEQSKVFPPSPKQKIKKDPSDNNYDSDSDTTPIKVIEKPIAQKRKGRATNNKQKESKGRVKAGQKQRTGRRRATKRRTQDMDTSIDFS
jgi:hypothetical protein